MSSSSHHGTKATAAAEKKRDIDYIFDELVGGCGKWQWRTTCLLFPLFWASVYPVFLPVFAASAPRHRCRVDQCDRPLEQMQQWERQGNLSQPWVDFAIPKGQYIIVQRPIF